MQILIYIGIGIGIIPTAIVGFYLVALLFLGPGLALAGLSAKIKGRHDDTRQSIDRYNGLDGSFFAFTFGWLAILIGAAAWSLDGGMATGLTCFGIAAFLWLLGWFGA